MICLIGTMSSHQQKGKPKVGSSEPARKRNKQSGSASHHQLIPRAAPRMYGNRGVLESERKYYAAHDETKYIAYQFIYKDNLLKEFPNIVHRIEGLQI